MRRRALEICEQGVDAARQLGAPTVKLWPGQDGFDYPFQADYRELWRLELDGVRAVADDGPGIRVAIEYKTKEPRIHISLRHRGPHAAWGSTQIGRDDVGIVVDLGHSLFAKETPADVLHAGPRARQAVHVEVNDNWREWDDDLAGRLGPPHRDARVLPRAPPTSAGTEPVAARPVPVPRGPGRGGAHQHPDDAAIDAALDRLDLDALQEARRRQDALAAQRLVLDLLLGGMPGP